MPNHLEDFPYPLLPVGVDAIRILTVEPGDFSTPLVGTLTSVTFSSKPKYVALSYTWGDPYPEDAAFPASPDETASSRQLSESISATPRCQAYRFSGASIPTNQGPENTIPICCSKVSSRIQETNRKAIINLNGCSLHIHNNLCLAMLHLRSPTHPLALWVDAICINQADMKERNAQVAMMSFIYTRALKVVAWLGAKEYRNELSVFESMASDWKAGQVRNLASSMAAGGANLGYSFPPDLQAYRIAESSYWTRLWVVQEACLPRLLEFVYGSQIWTYDHLRQFPVVKSMRSQRQRSGSSEDVGNGGLEAMLRLIDARDAKHTDAMMLEHLIEVFARNRCGELRDRVYGLLGLANDICPLSRVDLDADSIEDYINSLDLQQDSLPEPERDVGCFKIDYSRSFYNIWTDVVKFVFFRARNIEGRFRSQTLTDVPEYIAASLNSLLKEERRISVVRTAGIVQEALGQMVEEEVANLNLSKESASSISFSDRRRLARLTRPRMSMKAQLSEP